MPIFYVFLWQTLSTGKVVIPYDSCGSLDSLFSQAPDNNESYFMKYWFVKNVSIVSNTTAY
jgi:hypothetical protein